MGSGRFAVFRTWLIVVVVCIGLALKTQAQTPPATAPTYQQTVSYLTQKFQEAGNPGFTRVSKDRGFSGGVKTISDGTKYSITVRACESITITSADTRHYDDPHGDGSHHTDESYTTRYVIPLSSVGSVLITDHDIGIVSKDARILQSNVTESSDPADNNRDEGPLPAGQVIDVVSFDMPGSEETTPHVVKAIQYLVQYCASHPQQGPQDPF
jgi:hypothetical protein